MVDFPSYNLPSINPALGNVSNNLINRNLILSIPESLIELATNAIVSCEVVALNNSNLTLKTSQGLIVIQTSIDVKNVKLGSQLDFVNLNDQALQLTKIDGQLLNLPSDNDSVFRFASNAAYTSLNSDQTQAVVDAITIGEKLTNNKFDATLISYDPEAMTNFVKDLTSEQVSEVEVLSLLLNKDSKSSSKLIELNKGAKLELSLSDVGLKQDNNVKDLANLVLPMAIKDTTENVKKLTVQALVLKADHEGDCIFKTAFGIMKSPTNANYVKNDIIELTIENIVSYTSDIKPENILASKRQIINQLSQHWQSLDSIINVLKDDDSDVAQNFVDKLLPQTNNLLGAKLSNLIKAIRNDNINEWLGTETIKSLDELGKHSLIDKMTIDFTHLKDLLKPESNSNNWQTLLFPVFDGSHLHQNQMFIRQDHSKSDDQQFRDSRFIVQVEAEILGNIQIDGLVRSHLQSNSSKRELNMIIRSEKQLQSEVTNMIENIFNDATLTTGMVGKISFQLVKEFPTNPWHDTKFDSDSNDIIV